ncbi:heavy metal-binding domain-containing protein [Roseiarcus sp.]|uniref:heavy metal-binding domain-containing protein n=1 Tax=Roseiarcus sp. TaxID=1969460 RepID=UPI003F9974DD
MEAMQVSRTNAIQGGRDHYSIGRIKASSGWRAVNASTAEADRRAAVDALIRKAQDNDADAIIGLDFEVEGIKSADVDGTPLQRIAVTGIAVRFAEAA